MATQTIQLNYDHTKPVSGEIYLDEPTLGQLDLTSDAFVVTSVQIGHPSERPVVRQRALNDGLIDESTFVGGRAITIAVRLNNRSGQTTQQIIDALRPFMSPRYRPTLVWSQAGSPGDLRALTVRGVDAPIEIADPLYPVVVCSFLSSDSQAFDPTETCKTIVPSAVSEAGRTYTETYDKDYPAQAPFGSFIADNLGTGFADWIGTIFVGTSGTIVDPTISVNDVDMTFDQNTGLTMTAGQTLVIDTKQRTILLNDDPSTPRYDRVNFLDWAWDDLRLQPGENQLRLDHSGTSTEAAFTICWYNTWL